MNWDEPVRITMQAPAFLWWAVGIGIIGMALTDLTSAYWRVKLWRERRKYRKLVANVELRRAELFDGEDA